MKAFPLFAALLILSPGLDAKPAAKEAKKPIAKAKAAEKKDAAKKPEPRAQAFGWPFVEWQEMAPRGGTTQGSEVTLLTTPKESFKRVNEAGLAKFEQDRRAVLALAGNYRASFDFTESFGLTDRFKPARPHFSWGTENVTVLEDRGEFISLQHSLVMYFKNKEGKTEGPFVMKHWREDWTWQDKELHIYDKDSTWKRVPAPSPEGRWSQAVFQVDDSPRYEVMGAWTHDGGLSTWRSDVCPRPLPRREFSVRKDYNVLEGFHEVTLTPTGWVHLQSNRKLNITADGKRTYIGGEIGVNRYEEITAPDLAGPFNDYWAKTGDYWKDVRLTWDGIFKEKDTFTLKEEDNDEKLFSVHFGYAGELEKAEKPVDPTANLKHAQETIQRFLVK